MLFVLVTSLTTLEGLRIEIEKTKYTQRRRLINTDQIIDAAMTKYRLCFLVVMRCAHLLVRQYKIRSL